ncbi:MAG TPA: hypothetical protein EYF95_01530 [Flavobacteriales bacterium]|jgi:hypothetical protein|nr:hypothetical protein [Flavobacteriales bacterium]
MPKVTVTGAKGLVQSTGSGVDLTETTLVARPKVTTVSANTTLTQADSGGVFLVGTDALTITLPATVAGVDYTIVNTMADAGNLLTISPNASDGIHGTATLAATVVQFSGTDDADISLTKATGFTGNFIRLVGDGSVGWMVVGSSGIWAN